MPTLLVRNVPEELMRELRRLKVELGCRTWAELLEKLVRPSVVVVDAGEVRRAVEEFLELRSEVAARWGEGGVLDEFRRSRRGVEAADAGR